MGVFEIADFAEGTNAIAKAVAESDCTSIIGGGDSYVVPIGFCL